MKRLITLGILILSTLRINLHAQYAFGMSPTKGTPGTYVTFTGSGFIKNKTKAFIGDTPIPVVYTTRLHCIVRIPKEAETDKISIQIEGRNRKFTYRKPFKVLPITGKIQKNTGLYVSTLELDEGEANVYLFSKPNKNKKINVYHRDANPVNYRKIAALASGNVTGNQKWEFFSAIHRLPMIREVPQSAIFMSINHKKLIGYKKGAKKIYGYALHRRVESMTIAPFYGDNISDLIYSVEITSIKRTYLFKKLISMPRDIPLFSVPSKLKLCKINAVDFNADKKSKITCVIFDKKKWHLIVLKKQNSFKPRKTLFSTKAKITAVATGDINGDKKQELYVATYYKGQTKIYALTSPTKKRLIFSSKKRGKITSLAFVDFNKDGRDEIVAAFIKKNTSTVLYSKSIKGIFQKNILLLKKLNTEVTALTPTRY